MRWREHPKIRYRSSANGKKTAGVDGSPIRTKLTKQAKGFQGWLACCVLFASVICLLAAARRGYINGSLLRTRTRHALETVYL